MDLNTITDYVSAPDRGSLANWKTGDAWLGGGTYLFSEPQLAVDRLIDLVGFGWQSLEVTPDGLEIAATCKLSELYAFECPGSWTAAPLIRQCCDSLLGSFKIWNMATVGGNICTSLPAGPMTSLTASLDGVCRIWSPNGSDRTVAAADFVTGNRQNVLKQGELLRSIRLPIASLTARTAFRRISLTPHGRSAALLIGLSGPTSPFALTVTAATRRPIRMVFDRTPNRAGLSAAIETHIAESDYFDDIHGAPDWRRMLTFHLAEEIRCELGGDDA